MASRIFITNVDVHENYLVFRSQNAFVSYEKHHFAFQQSALVSLGNYQIKAENHSAISMELQHNVPFAFFNIIS